jgi:probable HAF family extracellular repeat protein
MENMGIRLAASALTALSVVLAGDEPRASQVQEERAYQIVELRSDGRDARGNGINASGIVAGYASHEGSSDRQAVVWQPGQRFDLGTFGGTNSNVTWPGQSNNGLVVGVAQTGNLQTRLDGWSCRGFFGGSADATKYTCVGFVWDGSEITALPLLGGDNSFAASSNNRRQVVGWAETASIDPGCIHSTDRGFLAVMWDLNRHDMVVLPPYGGDSASAATTVNDRGQVAGISGDCDQSVGRHSARHAVLWEKGTVKLLDSDSTNWNTPTSMTQNGDIIVGFSNTPGANPEAPTLRAVLWTTRDGLCPKVSATDMCVLEPVAGDTSAQAWGVNGRGQVVGTSSGAISRAFLWENGVTIDLNTVKGDYPHHLVNAMDINSRGQITGRAQRADGTFVAIVATPVHGR